MTYEQLQKMKMNQAVDTFIDRAPATIKDKIPNLNKNFAEFRLLNLKTLSNLETQQVDSTGYTADKNEIRTKLIAMALNISSCLVAHANQTENLGLFRQTKFSKRSLVLCSASYCHVLCKILHNHAKEHLCELQSFGLTQEMLSEYSILLAKFRLAIPAPRCATITTKVATLTIKESLKKSDKILVKMDILVNTMLTREPEFHKNYTAARKLVKPTYNPLAARGTITTSAGKPIPFVKMSCPELGIERKLSKKGTFKLLQIPDGDYIITFTKFPFQTLTIILKVTSGSRAELSLIMNEI